MRVRLTTAAVCIAALSALSASSPALAQQNLLPVCDQYGNCTPIDPGGQPGGVTGTPSGANTSGGGDGGGGSSGGGAGGGDGGGSGGGDGGGNGGGNDGGTDQGAEGRSFAAPASAESALPTDAMGVVAPAAEAADAGEVKGLPFTGLDLGLLALLAALLVAGGVLLRAGERLVRRT